MPFLFFLSRGSWGMGRRAGVRYRLKHKEGEGDLFQKTVLLSTCFLGVPQKHVILHFTATAAASLSPSSHLISCYSASFSLTSASLPPPSPPPSSLSDDATALQTPFFLPFPFSPFLGPHSLWGLGFPSPSPSIMIQQHSRP